MVRKIVQRVIWLKVLSLWVWLCHGVCLGDAGIIIDYAAIGVGGIYEISMRLYKWKDKLVNGMVKVKRFTAVVPVAFSDVARLLSGFWSLLRGAYGGHSFFPSLLHFAHKCAVFGGEISHCVTTCINFTHHHIEIMPTLTWEEEQLAHGRSFRFRAFLRKTEHCVLDCTKVPPTGTNIVWWE